MSKALAILLFLLSFNVAIAAQTTRDVEAYADGFAFMLQGDWRAALTEASEAGEVARDIIQWHRLRSGGGTFAEAQEFLERRADWPGLQYLMRRSERNLPFGTQADDVIAFFADQKPQTGHGAVALVGAYRAKGLGEEEAAAAVDAWLTHRFSEIDEALLLSLHGETLKPHHKARLDMLLWRGAKADARRMLPRVSDGWQKLAAARMALRESRSGIDVFVEAVPEALADDPGFLFERMQWRARKGRNADAIEVVLGQDADALGEPERWAGWRRSFARAEMRAGRTDVAYKLASEHGLESGSHFADLEWLSGYLALTYQNDAEKALKHFLRFRGAVETPISLGRAGYWEGRAHEALRDDDTARLAYLFGAEYQTSFYGLLAAEKVGKPMDPALAAPVPTSDLTNARFAASSVFEAAQLMLDAGQITLAERFLTHLTETLSEVDINRLGAWVLEQDQPHIAVMIGKRAASRGIVVPFAYYPVANLGLMENPVSDELALAIARRESEFDPAVTSHAGAKGLMQVMPQTARAVADYLDIRYSSDRLISDPAFNARIGTAYLDEMMALFDGNPVMVSAAYNAGPGRPIGWMQRNGDPRRGAMDVVDWIEHIPFNETRNYVMRVTESLPVYRARLTGQVSEITFTEELIGMPGHERQAVKGDFIRPKPRPERPMEQASVVPPEVTTDRQTAAKFVRPVPRARATN